VLTKECKDFLPKNESVEKDKIEKILPFEGIFLVRFCLRVEKFGKQMPYEMLNVAHFYARCAAF